MKFKLIIFLACIFSTACASWLRCQHQAPLPALAAVAELPLSAVQVLQIEYSEHKAELLCAFARQRREWKLACTTATGQRLITVVVDGERNVETHRAAGVPEALDGQEIAANFVFAFWPESDVQRLARDAGYSLEGRSDERILKQGDRQLMIANYAGNSPWNGAVSIKNLQSGYHLRLTTPQLEHAPH